MLTDDSDLPRAAEPSLVGRHGTSPASIAWTVEGSTSWAELTRFRCVDTFFTEGLMAPSASLLSSRTIDALTFELVFQPVYFPGPMGLRAHDWMELPLHGYDRVRENLDGGERQLSDPFALARSVALIIDEPLGMDDVHPGPDADGVYWRTEGLDPATR